VNLVLKTPPENEPVNLTEIKDYLRLDLDNTFEDTDLMSYLTAAREYCEGVQNRAYITPDLGVELRLLALLRY